MLCMCVFLGVYHIWVSVWLKKSAHWPLSALAWWGKYEANKILHTHTHWFKRHKPAHTLIPHTYTEQCAHSNLILTDKVVWIQRGLEGVSIKVGFEEISIYRKCLCVCVSVWANVWMMALCIDGKRLMHFALFHHAFFFFTLQVLSFHIYWKHPSVPLVIYHCLSSAGWGGIHPGQVASSPQGWHRDEPSHSHSHVYGNIRVTSSPNLHVFGLTDSWRTCKLHTAWPGNQTQSGLCLL